MVAATGFEVQGLAESILLLGRVDDQLRKEAGKVVRKAAVKLKNEARVRMASAPGVTRQGYPMPKTALSHRATAVKGVVGWNPRWTTGKTMGKGKAAVGGPAEFGWNSQFVPYRSGKGRFMPQNAMVRRTFPIWRGNKSRFPKYGERMAALAGPGWIVLPVLRKRLGQVQKEVDEGMAEVFRKSSRRAGIPGS